MRSLSAGVLAVLTLLVLALPAQGAPTHIGGNTGVVIALGLERSGPDVRYGEIEAAATRNLNAGWGSIYVSWAALQPSQDSGLDPGQVSVYHDRFASLKDQGRKVNVTFIDTPLWANGRPGGDPNDLYFPPLNPSTFGNFVAAFAKEFGGEVDGYELGNEPDGGIFWRPAPDPAKYAGYAKAGIAALEAADPTAVKFIGATAGANDEFIAEVLNQGVTGYDAVAFHSGTACKTDPPEHFIREETGSADIHNNNTTAYRELVFTMRSLGIENPVVADTAAGWSTLSAGGSCDTGAHAGKKPAGVTEAQQSLFLRDYLGCAEQDPELKYLFIFSLYDTSTAAKWDNRMGLRRFDQSPKQAYGELATTLASQAPPSFSKGGFCGGYVDHTAPTVELTTTAPVVNGVPVFSGALTLKAQGADGHPIKAVRIAADGTNIPGTTTGGVMSLEWQGAKNLKLGEHTITATAEDEAGNFGTATPLKVKKVLPSQMPRTATRLSARIKRVRGRKVTVSGRLSWPKGLVRPSGRIRIWFKKGRFVSKYSVSPKKPFTKTYRLRKPGRWSVNVFYDAQAPFKKSRAKRMSVRVR